MKKYIETGLCNGSDNAPVMLRPKPRLIVTMT